MACPCSRSLRTRGRPGTPSETPRTRSGYWYRTGRGLGTASRPGGSSRSPCRGQVASAQIPANAALAPAPPDHEPERRRGEPELRPHRTVAIADAAAPATGRGQGAHAGAGVRHQALEVARAGIGDPEA